MLDFVPTELKDSWQNFGFAGFLWLSLSAGAAILIVVGLIRIRSLDQQNKRIKTALDNMSQGLCMFDEHAKLILCNGRYIEMYGMSPEAVKPGRSLREVIEHRIAAGNFKGDPAEYVADVLNRIAKGKDSVRIVQLPNGRTVSLVERIMPGGGWVATHDDITEQRQLEKQRDTMATQEERRATVDAAIRSFRARIEMLLKTVGDSAAAMKTTAATLSNSSGQTSQRAIGAVDASNEASINVATAATAADQLSASIGEIGRQLGQTTGVLRMAASEAQQTNQQITGLADASQKIGDIVALIRNIAAQTNLLALNATIEAARAGEAGRGFAVVASEVKSLAVQTARATEDISNQIASVQSSTKSAVEAIQRITGRMQEIDSYATAVAASVEEQSAATSEISNSVSSAAQGTNDVVAVLDQLAGAATETRKTAEMVLGESETVGEAVSNLRSEVESFLSKVAV